MEPSCGRDIFSDGDIEAVASEMEGTKSVKRLSLYSPHDEVMICQQGMSTSVLFVTIAYNLDRQDDQPPY